MISAWSWPITSLLRQIVDDLEETLHQLGGKLIYQDIPTMEIVGVEVPKYQVIKLVQLPFVKRVLPQFIALEKPHRVNYS